jgi:antitoxin component YwqK of YwqJK toxin-antitoxin module
MFLRLILLPFIFISFGMKAQDNALEKTIVNKHPNGQPKVVIYIDKVTGDMMKEEVFFSNGKLEWTGTYKNSLENGLWIFYWDNGKVKTEETYVNGKEHGTSTQYDRDGKKLKESYWKHGKMLKEVKF